MDRERIEAVARDEYCLDHWGTVKAFADGAEWTMGRWNEELRAAKEAAFHEGYVQGKGAGIDFFTKGVSEGDEPNPYRSEGKEE